MSRSWDDWAGYLMSELSDDNPAVCIEHMCFIPCRTCLNDAPAFVPYSSERADVARVSAFQSGRPLTGDALEGVSVDDGLRALTRALAGVGAGDVTGGLGGSAGYGCDFENEIFGFKKFCWCDASSCDWCAGCSCPDAAWVFSVDGRTVDADTYFGSFGSDHNQPVVLRSMTRVPEFSCERCIRGFAAPNFWHKPTQSWVSWYKYIGRGSKSMINGRWSEILAESLASIPTETLPGFVTPVAPGYGPAF